MRFPSDGPIWRCLYRNKKEDDIYKSELLAAFLLEAKNRLNVPVSVDIYGFNVWYRFGNIIGQDAEKLSESNNILEIHVSNLMANRIIYMECNNMEYRNFYNVNFPARKAENRGADGLFTSTNWSPFPSGLKGPVTLIPITRIEF